MTICLDKFLREDTGNSVLSSNTISSFSITLSQRGPLGSVPTFDPLPSFSQQRGLWMAENSAIDLRPIESIANIFEEVSAGVSYIYNMQ